MESYLESQDLLEYVKGSLTTPLDNDEATIKIWKVRAAKAIYATKTSWRKKYFSI